MRRWIAAALAAATVLCIAMCTRHESTPPADTSDVSAAQTEPYAERLPEIRAVWVSYLELSMRAAPDRSAQAFRAKAHEIAVCAAENGMNTVFLHVRPFSDALYRSALFPYSAVLTGTEGQDPGYDALQIFCEEAAAQQLSVHAWINPFRIRATGGVESLAENHPARNFLEDDDPNNDHCVVSCAGGLYYDPASAEVQKMILLGVREIMENYPVDGVHIDDYFYPGTEPELDAAEYDAYRLRGGTADLFDWRRDVVSTFVRRLYRAVHSFGREKIFSISPAVNIRYNQKTLFADVARWAGEPGFCDWIVPQLYVGFEHETTPFTDAAAQWQALTEGSGVRLVGGLAAYKCGQTDERAGSGADEWVRQTDILGRQIQHLRSTEGYDGFAFFSFSYIFNKKSTEHTKKELQFVTSVL